MKKECFGNQYIAVTTLMWEFGPGTTPLLDSLWIMGTMAIRFGVFAVIMVVNGVLLSAMIQATTYHNASKFL
jgi:hypothetical protein